MTPLAPDIEDADARSAVVSRWLLWGISAIARGARHRGILVVA